MRRTSLASILSLLLLAAATVFAWRPVGELQLQYGTLGAKEAAALGCLLAAGVGGAIANFHLRRGNRILEKKLKIQKGLEKLAPLDAPQRDLRPLVESMNGLLEFAESSISSAASQVRELQIQLKVATAERQHAQAIIYSISDAVLVTDSFDELVLANDAAARTFDFELQAGRRPIDRVLADGQMVALIKEMRQRNSKSGRQVLEHPVTTPVGARTFKVTLSCVADRNGQPAGVVCVMHDMTRERELAQMKNDFVSSVSHELRTPLASIKAYTEMLIDGEAGDAKTQAEFYEVIHNEANRLERLIDNILNISRMESGLVKVAKRPQNLMVIIKEAIEVISPQAGQRSIHIDEQMTPAFYQTLADKDMLYQAVLNLLSNAVKYTPQNGKITVQTLVDETNRKVLARITDTGVGIPPKDLPFVFDKFYRSEANNHMAKGTGLGLSLVKHIVETVHHGRIFVESQPGKGSTFGFELDLID